MTVYLRMLSTFQAFSLVKSAAAVRARVSLAPWVLTLAKTTAAALVLSLLAQVRVHLPYTPVPITLQVLGVLLLGGVLGARLGAAAVGEYLLFGICGLPVFSGWYSAAGLCSAQHFATIGYLLAFLPAAMLVGVITARFPARSYLLRVTGGLLAGITAVLLCYLSGWAWLAYVCHLGVSKAFVVGICPFVVGELYKIGIAAATLALRNRKVEVSRAR